MKELYRVLKPRGQICILEPNLSGCSFYPLANEISEALVKRIADSVYNGQVGVNLLEMAKKAGFKEKQFNPYAIIYRDFSLVETMLNLSNSLDNMYEGTKAKKLITQFKQADKNKTFIFSIPEFMLLASK